MSTNETRVVKLDPRTEALGWTVERHSVMGCGPEPFVVNRGARLVAYLCFGGTVIISTRPTGVSVEDALQWEEGTEVDEYPNLISFEGAALRGEVGS